MSDVLKNILDLGVKYGPEVAQYFSGQKRISDQIERERRMEMPELQKMSAGTDVQFLLNQLNKDLTAPAREQLGADFEAAKEASIKTKGAKGIGNLANLLRSKGAAEAKLLQAGETAKTGIAAKTAPLTQAIQRYNIGVDDKGALFDFFKDQRIGALEDQSQRMKGRGARTLFDIIGDSRGLFADLGKKQDTFSGGMLPEVTIQGEDPLSDAKTLAEEEEEFGVVDGGVDPFDLAMYVGKRDLPKILPRITEKARSFGDNEIIKMKAGDNVKNLLKLLTNR